MELRKPRRRRRTSPVFPPRNKYNAWAGKTEKDGFGQVADNF